MAGSDEVLEASAAHAQPLKVKAPSGQHFLVKLSDAYPDGDMLLLITARSVLAD